MKHLTNSPIFRNHLPDLVAGLAVFALMIALTGWHIAIALSARSASVGANLDQNASAILLAGALAAMAVFNLAFFRHLCRVYQTPARVQRRSTVRSDGAHLP